MPIIKDGNNIVFEGISKIIRGDGVLFYGSPSPNTIIGGEGINTTTAGALETLLGLSSGQVVFFELVGNEIRARINVNYSIPDDCFRDNTDITSFHDNGNKVTSIGKFGFFGTTNMTSATLNAVTFADTRAFSGNIGWADINLPALTSCSGSCFRLNSGLTTVSIPLCASLGANSGNNAVFNDINSGVTITVPISLQTADGGNPDNDLVEAVSSGATIVYV